MAPRHRVDPSLNACCSHITDSPLCLALAWPAGPLAEVQYVQSDQEADRQVATTLAELIIGGSLVAVDINGKAADGSGAVA